MNMDQSSIVSAETGYEIVQGRFPAETILKYRLELGDTWQEARNKLFGFWLARPEPLRSCAFVTHAEEFDMEYDAERISIAPGWDWQPSAYFSSPLEAFDRGITFAQGGMNI